MKSLATSALAGLMLLGTISAIALPKAPVTFSDGGPVPLCQPTQPNCPPPMATSTTSVTALTSDGGPVPLCQPTQPNCPPPMAKTK